LAAKDLKVNALQGSRTVHLCQLPFTDARSQRKDSDKSSPLETIIPASTSTLASFYRALPSSSITIEEIPSSSGNATGR
jgi:hypothetical protein